MRSPSAPAIQRETERAFWLGIAKGLLPAEAAVAVGASQPVGSRWFRHSGGMPPLDLGPPSGRYLSLREREEIALLKAKGAGVRRIARELGARAVDDLSRADAGQVADRLGFASGATGG